jgi:hypothetical protein
VATGSAATVVDVVDVEVVDVEVVDDVDVLVLVVLLLLVVAGTEDVVVVAGAPTRTTVDRWALCRMRLVPATATTRAATTMQRLRSIDACFILRLTLQRLGKLPPRRCSSVTAWEGLQALLRPTSGVGEIDELVVARAAGLPSPRGVPHVWAMDDRLMVTVASDASPEELRRMAETYRYECAWSSNSSA